VNAWEKLEMAKLYEALRAQALGEAPLGLAPLGLAVLRHRGMAGWMATEARARADRAPAPLSPSWEASGRSTPLALTSELVRLLAGAALLTMSGRVP